ELQLLLRSERRELLLVHAEDLRLAVLGRDRAVDEAIELVVLHLADGLLVEAHLDEGRPLVRGRHGLELLERQRALLRLEAIALRAHLALERLGLGLRDLGRLARVGLGGLDGRLQLGADLDLPTTRVTADAFDDRTARRELLGATL